MESFAAVLIVIGPIVLGVHLLKTFYREERLAGRAKEMFRHRDREGRWGSTLIFMGSTLFFVMGTEMGLFDRGEWQEMAAGITGIFLLGIMGEGVAWLWGRYS